MKSSRGFHFDNRHSADALGIMLLRLFPGDKQIAALPSSHNGFPAKNRAFSPISQGS
jgi:hypothetical protein